MVTSRRDGTGNACMTALSIKTRSPGRLSEPLARFPRPVRPGAARLRTPLYAVLLTLVWAATAPAQSVAPDLTVVPLVSGLRVPWGLAFAPDGTLLFTERGGRLSSRRTDGTVQPVSADFGDLLVSGEAGLMALVVDPAFAANRRFYTCQAHTGPEVQVIAWTINATYTAATRTADPLVGNIPAASRHSGCRLRFGPQGYLWIATGDATVGTAPQDLDSLGGKVLRVNAATGAAAAGNPFGSRIYTYGHRNVQGLARRPGTDQMWAVEHGPRVDDEINLLLSGGNYGWDPVPGYNEGVPMTDLVKFPSAVEARWSSGNPTLATSGGIFLEGAQWGRWEGRLAVASLKDQTLRVFRFTPAGAFVSQVVVPELDGTYGRLRTPMLGPAGALYVTTSNGDGDRILKVVPGQAPDQERPAPVGYLENPGPDSFQSGIGVISGWVCEAEAVEIEIETERGEVRREMAGYGTARADTAVQPDGTRLCGDTDNGFGLLFNWNRLGEGDHTVVALVDGVELGRATVTVTTVGTGEEEEFLRDAEGACVVEDFPLEGEAVTLEWQETQQNFVITRGPRPAGTNMAGVAGEGYLENPGPNSFQSGIGVISGWVCEAEGIAIEFETEQGAVHRYEAAYGTARADTLDACGDTNNGFGLLFNWNRLGEGEHTVVAYVDGMELGRATVRVTTVGAGAEEEFLRDVAGECLVADFPMPGETVLLVWQQNSQNFVIAGVE